MATKEVGVAGGLEVVHLRKQIKKEAMSMIQSFISNTYVKEGFLQLSLESNAPVRMHSTVSERVSKALEVGDVQTPSQPSMLGITDRLT